VRHDGLPLFGRELGKQHPDRFLRQEADHLGVIRQLHLRGAGVSGQGGLCLGDSGSPQFLGSSNAAVSQLSFSGDSCREIVAQRLDTQAERRFLSRFVDLP